MMKKFVICLALLLALHLLLQACDMSALILRNDKVFSDFGNAMSDNGFSDFDVPVDYLAFVMSRSNSSMHNDGYGILHYQKENFRLPADNSWYKYVHSAAEANQVWYTGNYFDSTNPQDVFDKALQAIRLPENRASMVLCHARNASSSPFAPGNHPFRLNLNNRTYSLMHNGFVSYEVRMFMINEIYNLDADWFTFQTPNFSDFTNAAFPSCWIDSEVLFHYLMCHIKEENFDVNVGMRTALKKLEPYMELSTEVVNFVFSDGERLYTFRSTPLMGMNSAYKLSFRADESGFSAVRTGVAAAAETEILMKEMVVLNDKGGVERYPDFLDDPVYYSYRFSGGPPSGPQRSLPIAPNLSHPGISITFKLEEAAQIVVNIYNLKGQKVRCINSSVLAKGSHTIRWDGSDRRGKPVSRGVYYIELIKDKQRTISKVIYSR